MTDLNLESIAIDLLKSAFVAIAKYLQTSGTDPKALLNAELDAADAAAVAELEAKFPDEP